jgi:hypothetical protein
MLLHNHIGIKQARGKILHFEKQYDEEREAWSRSTEKKGAPVHLQIALQAVIQKMTYFLIAEHLELIEKIKSISKVVESLAGKNVQDENGKSPASAVNKPWTKMIKEGCIRCLGKSCEEHTRVYSRQDTSRYPPLQ